jgi:polypeptide N-acetylgalactosaminyltransferase
MVALPMFCAEDLKDKLDAWVCTDPDIKIVRLTKREGLIRARMAGANVATGEVLVFLDSHCECSTGWLEPMLERIHLDRSTVVCPVIDKIHAEMLEYLPKSGGVTERGGFNWGLEFKWRRIPKYENDRRKGDPSM